jgi:hypothetical protein
MANMNPRDRMIAKAIRIELLRRGLSAAEVGLRMGVSGDHVSNVISGSSKSRILRLQIEDFLGMGFWSDVKDFLTREEQ